MKKADGKFYGKLLFHPKDLITRISGTYGPSILTGWLHLPVGLLCSSLGGGFAPSHHQRETWLQTISVFVGVKYLGLKILWDGDILICTNEEEKTVCKWKILGTDMKMN